MNEMILDQNLREIMVTFNHCLGFTLFNCPIAFLIYLSISTGIPADHLISFLKKGEVQVVSQNLQYIFLHGEFVASASGHDFKYKWGNYLFNNTTTMNGGANFSNLSAMSILKQQKPQSYQLQLFEAVYNRSAWLNLHKKSGFLAPKPNEVLSSLFVGLYTLEQSNLTSSFYSAYDSLKKSEKLSFEQ